MARYKVTWKTTVVTVYETEVDMEDLPVSTAIMEEILGEAMNDPNFHRGDGVEVRDEWAVLDYEEIPQPTS